MGAANEGAAAEGGIVAAWWGDVTYSEVCLDQSMGLAEASIVTHSFAPIALEATPSSCCGGAKHRLLGARCARRVDCGARVRRGIGSGPGTANTRVPASSQEYKYES